MSQETTNGVSHEGTTIVKCRVYRIRWVILLLFVLYASISLMQWIEYSAISDVIVKYYGVSYAAADWTSIISMLTYIPLAIPGSYLLDKLTLRTVILIGMTGSCIGAWIKIASIASDRYWILLVGQGIATAFQVLLLPVPPKLAAVWFGPKEISTACGLAVVGSQLGIAVGYLLPPILVNQKDRETIENGLYTMALGVAISSTIILILIFCFFKTAPPMPPSIAQSKLQESERNTFNFINTVKHLIRNLPYVLLFVAFGIHQGIFYAVATLLSEIILNYYPNSSVEAGRIGFVLIISCMVGSIACGIILDKFNQYKATLLTVYAISTVSMLTFTLALGQGIAVIYFISGLLGFSFIGVLTTGLEVSAEITYPEPEGTSAGLLVAGTQVFGLLFTFLHSFIFHSVGITWANLTMFMLLFVGFITASCIKFDLRRSAAQTINQ